MQYRTLGRTGLRVSQLCLGAMTFGHGFYGIGEVDQAGATALVRRAVEGGINFFDTADVYSWGQSETILGQALKELGMPRDEVVIATKVRAAMSEAARQGTGDVNNVGLSRKHILAACEASLHRLGTDYIDLYQVHGVDPLTPLDETMDALASLVQQGKVRYVGCSNYAVRHIMRANHLAERPARFVSLQAYYSLAGRDLEIELLPLCREEGLGVLVWSPLAGGFLTGKYRRDQAAPEGARRSGFDFPPLDRSVAYDIVETLDAMTQAKGATIPQLALAWLLQQDGISSVIVGAKRLDQLEDNLGAIHHSFSPDELARLDVCSPPPTPYPQWMIAFQGQDRQA